MGSTSDWRPSDYVALYSRWHSMVWRCTRPSNPQWSDYGGRGISVCAEWLDFDTYADWFLAQGGNRDLQVDRTDNDGNYSPVNCRLVTRTRNARNKRNTVFLTAFGETKAAQDWAEDARCAVDGHHLVWRARSTDWTDEEKITRPAVGRRPKDRCAKNHLLTEDNVYVRGDGYRVCKICTKAYARKSYQNKKKAAPAAA